MKAALVVMFVWMLFLILPSILAKDIFWSVFWTSMLVLLGATEALSFVLTGQTLTSRFEAMSLLSKLCMALGFSGFNIYLIGHLFFKW